MHTKTIALQHGYDNSLHQKTMSVPIYQTTAYQFDSAEHGANLFDLKELGNIYTRLNNPTCDVLEQRITALEKGAGGLAVASGSAAIFYAVTNLLGSGDNIVAARQLYGGTTNLFKHTLANFGIEVRFFDGNEPQQARELIDEKTKVLFFETLTNPGIEIPQINALADIANEFGIVSIIDNTVATPVLCRPIEHGVDVVVHSASKYINGQGSALGGLIVERENLVEKIKGNKRYKKFNEPDESYHGLVYTEVPFPLFTLRIRLSLLRDIGAALSPFNAWVLLQGLETLSVRVKEHSRNALAVAEFLQSHPKVKNVYYPGLKDDKFHKNASQFFKDSFYGGLLSFDVGDFELAKNISNNVKIFTRAVNIGDSKSIITHPASTTHRQVKAEELEKDGITQGFIRLSIGLEDSRDLIEDLTPALKDE